MNDNNELTIHDVLLECQYRAEQAGDPASRISYESVCSMLEYLVAGDTQCLAQFMNHPTE